MIKNQLNILGQGVAIKFTSSRHYSVLISKRYEALDKFTEENSKSIFLSTDNKSDRQVSKKKKENSRKLHNQFGNSNARKILRLVKVSGIQCNEIFEEKLRRTDPFQWNKEKSPLKPVVEFSLSKDFNVVEAMDLIEVNGSKILHMTDATRYTATVILKSKYKEEIVHR